MTLKRMDNVLIVVRHQADYHPAAQLSSEGAARVFQDFSESALFLESLYELTQAV
jgi:hypothetical protein